MKIDWFLIKRMIEDLEVPFEDLNFQQLPLETHRYEFLSPDLKQKVQQQKTEEKRVIIIDI